MPKSVLAVIAALALVAAAEPVEISQIDAAIASGHLEIARSLVERAAIAAPLTPALELRKAELLLAGNAATQAVAAYAGLTVADPANAAAWQGLGLATLATGDIAPASAALDRALALDPAQPRAWNALAVIADRRKDWPAAEIAYGRALALTPNDAQTLSNRGYSRILQGRDADAVADLTQALKLSPKLEVARTNRRLALAMGGNYDAAFAGASRKDLVRDLNTVGFGAMLHGDIAAARGYFSRAIEKNPEFDRTAWRNLAYLNSIAPRPTPGNNPALAPPAALAGKK